MANGGGTDLEIADSGRKFFSDLMRMIRGVQSTPRFLLPLP